MLIFSSIMQEDNYQLKIKILCFSVEEGDEDITEIPSCPEPVWVLCPRGRLRGAYQVSINWWWILTLQLLCKFCCSWV